MNDQELLLRDIQDVLKKYPGSYIKASDVDSFEIRISGNREIGKSPTSVGYMFIDDDSYEHN